MNRVSVYAILFAFILAGSFWTIFIRGNSPDKLTLEGEIMKEKINSDMEIDNKEKIMQAILHTNKGDIVIEFDSINAPNAVTNFIKLSKEGFYDGTKFHRIVKDFMNQGGDPFSKEDSLMDKWGTGGPGYTFADELGPDNHNVVGTISMANAGPDTNGSQFFINVADNTYLDGKHTVFGKVITGFDVVKAINSVETDDYDRPTSPIIIESISLK